MKTKYFTILLLALMVLGACDDFLDEPTNGIQQVDNYFKTEEECKAFVTGCYSGTFQDNGQGLQYLYVLLESATDDAWLSAPDYVQNFQEYRDIATFNIKVNNATYYTIWMRMYQNIYQCNLALESLGSSPVAKNNPEFIKRLKAEVQFIRAYSYFELAKNFKELPILDKVHGTEELKGITASSQEDVYSFIQADLKAAASALPQKAQYAVEDAGRATKGAAWAYLAKSYLYTEGWQQVDKYCDSVIQYGGYMLEQNFGSIWDINNVNGVESIFEFQTNYDPNYATGCALPVWTGGYSDNAYYNAAPTSNLERQYLALNDTFRLRATIIKADNYATMDADGVGLAKVYAADGKTIAVSAQQVAEFKNSKSMRVNRKFYILPEERIEDYHRDNGAHIKKNFIFMRLAEVKLMKAEALWHLGRGNDSEIQGILNELRTRGEMDLPLVTATGEELLNAIYLERRLELAGELKRWDDIRRLKAPGQSNPLIYQLMGTNGAFVKYNTESNNDVWEKHSELERSDKGVDFTPGDEWLPLPARDLTFLNN